MAKTNPFEDIVNNLVDEMHAMSNEFGDMASGVPPFDSSKPTPEEDALIFAHPAARYPGVTDPTTGLPLTNAQAAQRMYAEMGPDQYSKWVMSHARRLGWAGANDGPGSASSTSSY